MSRRFIAIEDDEREIEEYGRDLAVLDPDGQVMEVVEFIEQPPGDIREYRMALWSDEGDHENIQSEVIPPQPKQQVQFQFNASEIVKAVLLHLDEYFKETNDNPNLEDVYYVARDFINGNYAPLASNPKGIEEVLKVILRRIKLAINADAKLAQKIQALKVGLDESFRDYVQQQSESIGQMDIDDLKQMIQALNCLLKLCERKLDIHGYRHRSLVIIKRIFANDDMILNPHRDVYTPIRAVRGELEEFLNT